MSAHKKSGNLLNALHTMGCFKLIYFGRLIHTFQLLSLNKQNEKEFEE